MSVEPGDWTVDCAFSSNECATTCFMLSTMVCTNPYAIRNSISTLDYKNIQLQYDIKPSSLSSSEKCRVSYKTTGSWIPVIDYGSSQNGQLLSETVTLSNANDQSSISIKFEIIASATRGPFCYVDEVYIFGTPLSTNAPTNIPTINPISLHPTTNPTFNPTIHPISSHPTTNPTFNPTINPSNIPTKQPTFMPTITPTFIPTINPSNIPTINPTLNPTSIPTFNPIFNPTSNPTFNPTFNPTVNISTEYPTSNPTSNPTFNPTAKEREAGTDSSDIETTFLKNAFDSNSADNTILYYIIILAAAIICTCFIMIGVLVYMRRRKRKKINNNKMMEGVHSHSETTTNTNTNGDIEMEGTNKSTINVAETGIDDQCEGNSDSDNMDQLYGTYKNKNVHETAGNTTTIGNFHMNGSSDSDELFDENLQENVETTKGNTVQ